LKGLGLKQSDIEAGLAKAAGERSVARSRIRSAASTNAANRRSREKTAAANRRVTEAGQTETHRHNVAQENKPGKQPKEPPAAAEFRRGVNQVAYFVDGLRHSGHSRQRTAEILRSRALRQNKDLPNDVLSIALDLIYDGHVSRHNRDVLRQAGVRIPRSWMPKAS